MKFILVFIIILTYACAPNQGSKENKQVEKNQINCTDESCRGTYIGKEFIYGSDVAHQFSNKMSTVVGDKLKELYKEKKYSKVDFSNIEMTTDGMGSGMVKYNLQIPFVRVKSKCDSYTSFDHVGGWNHAPAIEQRKKTLETALLPGDSLNISQLKKTKEGLEEYWLQWRNQETQFDCINNK